MVNMEVGVKIVVTYQILPKLRLFVLHRAYVPFHASVNVRILNANDCVLRGLEGRGPDVGAPFESFQPIHVLFHPMSSLWNGGA